MSRRREKKRSAENSGVPDIPEGAVAANTSRQVPNNSYTSPPTYYIDIAFACCDCGSDEVWTAQQQKWYYEVAKGTLYTTAVRCRDCRNRKKDQKGIQHRPTDANLLKHPAMMLARIRDAVAPSLAAAGFEFDGRNKPPEPVHLYLDYSRGQNLFRLSWDRRDSNRFIGFIAEFILEPDVLETVVSKDLSDIAELPRSKAIAEIQMQIDEIAKSINNFLKVMPGPFDLP